MTGLSATAIVAVASIATGCTREQLGACPDIGVGELVVTEFRGPQDPDDTLGPWVELYNASTATLDLEGLKVRFRRKDGSSEIPIIVRRSIMVSPGAYVVLGLVPDDASRPVHIDYGFANDFSQGFLAAAAVDVESCGERIDRAVYDVLPKTGTYSFGGDPDADANDIQTLWCENPSSPGTPKQANPPCP